MSRLTAAIAILLALLTGLVLGQVGYLAMRPTPAESRPSAQAPIIAQSFYEDLNGVLATGERSVDTAIASSFLEHTTDEQGDRTLAEMVDRLLAVRVTWPRLRMTVVDVEQFDRLVSVRLRIDPGDPADIPGIPLPVASEGEVLEFLQIEGGGVTDRWDSGAGGPVATVDLRADVAWDDPSVDLPAIQHVALDSNESIQLPLDAPLLLLGETGSVEVSRAGTDLQGTSRSAREPLQIRDVRILEGAKDRILDIRNESDDPAALWVFSTDFSAAQAWAPPEATPEPVIPGLVAFLPVQRPSSLVGGATRISITRLTLPAGATVPVQQLGAIVEIVVLEGALEVTIAEGRALLCSDGGARPFEGTETVSVGEGVSARESASLGYHVAGLHLTTILVMHVELQPGNTGSP